MKKTINKICLIIMILIACSIYILQVYGVNYNEIYGGDTTIKNMGGKIVYVVQYICYFIAIVVLIVKGAQFMLADPEGKAKIKQEALNYVIGATALFAIGTIVKIIGNASNTMLK